MDKQQLIDNLKNNTYCKLDRSDINGIGVFAIRMIPKNINPFLLSNNYSKQYTVVDISKEDLKEVPKSVVKLLNNYFLTDKDKWYPVISMGLNDMDISFYLNHSDTPNVESVFPKESTNELLEFRTIKKIKSGEELTLTYSLYEPCKNYI